MPEQTPTTTPPQQPSAKAGDTPPAKKPKPAQKAEDPGLVLLAALQEQAKAAAGKEDTPWTTRRLDQLNAITGRETKVLLLRHREMLARLAADVGYTPAK